MTLRMPQSPHYKMMIIIHYKVLCVENVHIVLNKYPINDCYFHQYSLIMHFCLNIKCMTISSFKHGYTERNAIDDYVFCIIVILTNDN